MTWHVKIFREKSLFVQLGLNFNFFIASCRSKSYFFSLEQLKDKVKYFKLTSDVEPRALSIDDITSRVVSSSINAMFSSFLARMVATKKPVSVMKKF
jgi:hypothetical protein